MAARRSPHPVGRRGSAPPAGGERSGDGGGGEGHSPRRLPAPVRVVGDGAAPGELGFAPVGVEQPPMAADRALELALPGLIVGLDQIDPIVLASGEGDHLMQRTRLIHRRRQGGFAHAAGARPSELAHENVLIREGRDDPFADGIDVPGGIARGNGEVLPVGEDMDGDEVDGSGDLAVAQPELPHIGIGYRHRHLCLDLTDGAGEVGRRHFAPQQHLVADDDCGDHVGIPVGQRDGGFDLVAAAIRPVRQPEALQYLQTVAAGDFGYLVQTVVDRVGAHAIADALELGQILVDLPGVDRDVRSERVLGAAEGGIRDAVQLLARGER